MSILISKEDAIDVWWHDEVFFGNQRDDMTKEQWLDYITDVIGSLPSAETPTVSQKHQLSEEIPTNTPTDLISRQEALRQLCEDCRFISAKDCEYGDVCKTRNFIMLLPSADRPTGEWVSEDGTPSEASYSVYCSRCGQWSEYRGFFCLWYGARMGGGPND